jgi:hypothetical protein
LVLWLLFLVKGKLNIELQSVPDALPDPYPFIRGMVVTWYTASTVDPGSGTPDRWSSSGRSFQQARILNTALAIPRPTRWHPIKTSAEDMAKLLAAMAVHELWCVTELVADHTCVIASVILQCVIVLDNHRRIDIGDLFLVLHGVLG